MEDEFGKKPRDFMQGQHGHYPVVTGDSYGDEIEINYFQKRERNFVIKENSQLVIELKMVYENLSNTRGHYSFEEQL